MLRSIEIKYFRGIREGRLDDLTPVVVLVGPNGCGKSSVLDAALIGAGALPAAGVVRVVGRHRGVVNRAEWLFWRRMAQPAPSVLVKSEGSERLVEMGIAARNGIDCISFPDGKRSRGRKLTSVARSLEDVKGAAGGDAFKLDDIAGVWLIDESGEADFTPLQDLYSDLARTGRRDQAKAVMAEIVPGLTDVEILTEGNQPVLYFVFGDHSLPAALAGDGIHALLRLTLELLSREGGLMLLEEPETHKHPAAIRLTARVILAAARRNIQTILATHSLELIDSLLAEAGDGDLDRLSLWQLRLQNDGELLSRRIAGREVAFLRGEIESDLR